MRGRRSIVTGTGVVCAAGRGLPAVWEAVATGRSALRSLTLFESPRYGSHAVGQIEANLHIPPGRDRGSRSDHLARIAAHEALVQAGLGLPPNLATPQRWGLVVGATVGGMDLSEQFVAQVLGAGRPDYRVLRFHECGGIADRLAAWLGIRGPTVTLSTACSAGALALATAAAMIDRGEADRVLAGGCDALCRLTLNGFGSLLLLDPAGCRPFDANRAGISLGEGAAFLVLEAEASARERGARPLARLSGFGTCCDAWHATAPEPEGRGAAAAMQAALSTGGIKPAEIDFVCAHGTGTPDNDVMEARALRTVFGERVPPFSSNKRCFGHTLAASGALNAALCVQALQWQALPPNPGFDTPDPAVGLEPIRTLQRGPVRHVLSNAFGFGGNNVALVLSLPDQSAVPRTLPASVTPSPFFRSSRFSSERFPILGAAAVGPAGNSLERIYASVQGTGLAPAVRQLPPRLGGHHVRVLACGDPASASVADRVLARRLSRIQMRVLAAARDSVAGVAEGIPGNRCCVALGTALGLLSDTAAFVENMVQRDERAPRPTHFTNSVHNALASQVALHLGFTGLNATLSQRETSFEAALWHAVNELATDRTDLAIAGAADELHPYALATGVRWGWWPATDPTSAEPGPDPGSREPSDTGRMLSPEELARLPGEGAALFALGRTPGPTPPLAWISAVRLGRWAGDSRGYPQAEEEARWITSTLRDEGEPLDARDLLLVNLPPPSWSGRFNRELGRALLGRDPASYQQVCGCFGSASALGLAIALGVVRGAIDPHQLLTGSSAASLPGRCRRVLIYTWSPAGGKGLLCVTA